MIAAAVPAVALAAGLTVAQLQPGRHQAGTATGLPMSADALVTGGGISPGPVLPLDRQAAPVKNAASATPKPSASAKPEPAAKPKPRPAPLACADREPDGTGMLPWNYASIVDFLVQNGYTKMAAAGVAGNIWQESKGDPESVGTGGGGLIGWTPLPAGFVTGNVTADLRLQLRALLAYNNQWAAYLPALNAAGTPADAAYIYMADFERPGIPATSNREGAAIAVAQACGIS